LPQKLEKTSSHTCVDYWAEHRPEQMALIDNDHRWTFSELSGLTTKLANAFVNCGLAVDDRVAFLGKNRAIYGAILVAVSRAGLTIAPLGWRLTVPELCYIVNDTAAKMLICEPDFADTAVEVQSQCPKLHTIYATKTGCQHATIDDLMSEHDGPATLPADDIDRSALQLYTSGTTGNPKGVMICNRNLFGLRAGVEAAGFDWTSLYADDKALVAMPIAHIAGSGYLALTLHGGIPAQFIPEFTPDAVIEAIEDGASHVFLVPTAIQMVINTPRAASTDFSPLRFMHYGASPMPLALLKQAMNVLQCGFVQHYGMTETTGTFTCLHPDDHDPKGNKRMRSAGLPVPGVEVRIVDDNNQPVAVDEVGEIVTRGKNNMIAYWQQPEKTAETVDADGWLHTGDAGYMDADGYVYIHDRVKDMIISGGENVYPAEVENVLYSHEDVLEAAVIGVPDDKWGEAVKAVIVAKSGHEIDPENIIAFARESLAPYKTPKTVEVIPAMPRNASGKILRRELRAPYWEGKERQVN
jgi:fatty-acyl-CoA synthase